MSRRVALTFAALGLVALAGCSTRKEGHVVQIVPLADVTMIAVGVEDLRAEDMDRALASGAGPAPDQYFANRWAKSTGLLAAAAALDLRTPLAILREPRRIDEIAGLDLELAGVSPRLRSAHLFDQLFASAHVIDDTEELSELPFHDGLPVRAFLLDSSTDLEALLRAIRGWYAETERTLFVTVFGFPRRIEDPRRDLKVPVYSWSPGEVQETFVREDRSPLSVGSGNGISADGSEHWLDGTPSDFQTAAWPGEGDARGGVFATNGALSMWSEAEGFVFHEDVAGADTPTAREELSTRLATELFGGVPRAWIAVRGSEVVDFVDLSVFGHMPLTGRVTPWALEEIDTVWEPNANSVRYSLGAEDLGDGVVLDLGWPPFAFEVRLAGALSGGHWLGAPMYVGADATSWGFRALKVEPFSRAFWLATAGGWPKDADAWWPDAPIGVHVRIDGTADTPVPAVLEERSR